MGLNKTMVELDKELEEIRRRKMAEMTKKAGGDWPSAPVEVSDSNFDEFIKKYNTVVVDCWAPWCGPCRMVAPVVDALAKDLSGKVAFGKLNTDNNQKIALRFYIEAIPTLLVFKNGEMVDRIIGAMPKDALMQKLKPHL